MFILTALMFSLSSNLDNIIIGIAYGIKKIKISIRANLIIALITSFGTLLSMSAGKYIVKLLPESIANSLGAMIIILLGIYFIIHSIIKFTSNRNPKELALKNIKDMMEYAEESDINKSGDIDAKEAILIAFGLTFNNLATGVAASITGVSVQFTVIFTLIFSILTIKIGQAIGDNILGKFLGKYAPLFSGILLILLGVFEYLN